jgi:hypothetical protein
MAEEEMVNESGGNGLRLDFLIKVRQQENEQVLVIEFKNKGRPRQARDAVKLFLLIRSFILHLDFLKFFLLMVL